jgi:predicted DNA-binding transcriptional regulator AlpA
MRDVAHRPLVYSKAGCAEALSLSTRTLDRLKREGEFDVRPIQLTRKAIGFCEDEVRAWVERKKQERDEKLRSAG